MKKHFHEIHGLMECSESEHQRARDLIKLLKVKGCTRTGNRMIRDEHVLLRKLRELDITIGEILFGSN